MPDAVFYRWRLSAPPGAPGPIYTNAKLTVEDAARMFPGAVPVEESREVRFIWHAASIAGAELNDRHSSPWEQSPSRLNKQKR